MPLPPSCALLHAAANYHCTSPLTAAAPAPHMLASLPLPTTPLLSPTPTHAPCCPHCMPFPCTHCCSHPPPQQSAWSPSVCRWSRHSPVNSTPLTTGTSSHGNLISNPHSLSPLTPISQRGCTQYTAGPNPEGIPHSTVGVSTASGASLFVPANHCQCAPSASGGTMTTQITPPAICPPCGITLAPLLP